LAGSIGCNSNDNDGTDTINDFNICRRLENVGEFVVSYCCVVSSSDDMSELDDASNLKLCSCCCRGLLIDLGCEVQASTPTFGLLPIMQFMEKKMIVAFMISRVGWSYDSFTVYCWFGMTLRTKEFIDVIALYSSADDR
jgi:hypothetical protein